MSRIIAIVQARMTSSRLPNKVLKRIEDKPILWYVINQLKYSKKIDNIIVATSKHDTDDLINKFCFEQNINCYRGSLNNVLERYYEAAKCFNADIIVRITADCPLIDPQIVDDCINTFLEGNFEYVSNTVTLSFPDGYDCEVFSIKTLEKVKMLATTDTDFEHVTYFISSHKELFKVGQVIYHEDLSYLRLTLDESEDFILIESVIKSLFKYDDFIKLQDVIEYLLNNKLYHPNKHKRNEGLLKSIRSDKMKNLNLKNSKLYREKVHQIIPGGAHTYSKGDDQFPQMSPAAIKRGKGAYIWDIDDNKFLDCSMGLTAVSLGHAYEPVLKKVREVLELGVNFQRPSYLELETAEKFLSLVPQHDMIKFAKNGSTVTTAAVKLARGFTGRKLVAFPYDHPFYSYDDWFIGKTPCDLGIPTEIKNLSVTYKADDINSLNELFQKYPDQIACVISEPEKNFGVDPLYLQKAIDLTHKNGSLYIVDEMITGFKTFLPGSLVKFNVKPDMATWGKGIANGFSFCALTGTKEVMKLGGITEIGKEKLFLISTTHGGETHAFAAAMATIDEFLLHNVIEHIHKVGGNIISEARKIIHSNQLDQFIQITDSNWQPLFIFKNINNEIDNGYRTLFMQEMIQNRILFQGIFQPCFSHKSEEIIKFLEGFNLSCKVYKDALEYGWEHYLVGEPTKPVFRKFL